MTTIEQALRCAVNTAREQPAEVPYRSMAWIARAEAALDAADEAAIQACADDITLAHSQYRADFDEKGWLFDLRNLRFDALMAERKQVNAY